ncbi:MAG: lytic murein transglycosylase [Desulfarculales bacterium]|jgi:membrane-bound lytic murein transglycosylase B|nr:lytic murein transglycosylase [Desulfarculales bacterium]
MPRYALILLVSIFFVILCHLVPGLAQAPFNHNTSASILKPVPSIFIPLQQWLIAQGLDSRQVNLWLTSSQVHFEGKLLASMLSHRDASRDYKNFFTKNSLLRAKNFQARYKTSLEHTQKTTSVPQEIILAIILIESNLGSFTGATLTFNALASQAALDTEDAIDILRVNWPKNQLEYLDSEASVTRFATRAAWARQELLALIRLTNLWQKEIMLIKGSPAGAIGWCQFMPTSIEKWGSDGSGDYKIDLDNPHDAIASVGRYLQEHGWQTGLSYEEQVEVILTYNKSRAYAEAVLNLAEKL